MRAIPRHAATRLVLAALVVLAAPGAGCTVIGSVLAEETDEQRLSTVDDPHIVVETFNGYINVSSGGPDTLEVRYTRRGSGNSQDEAEEDLANVEVTVEQAGERITITARRRDRPLRLGESGADFELIAPPEASLELRSSNGRIQSSNIGGAIVARSSNGAITLRGGEDIDAETTNAPLTVSAASGNLDLRTSNGAIDVVTTVEVVITAQTTNGTISFNGGLSEGDHLFRTTNAAISLTLPTDAAFTITGTTTNAAVRTDFDELTVDGGSISGSVGEDPATAIRADTSNGVLSILRGR